MAENEIIFRFLPISERHNGDDGEYLEYPSVRLDVWLNGNVTQPPDYHRCQDVGDLPGEDTYRKATLEAQKWLARRDNITLLIDAILERIRLYEK